MKLLKFLIPDKVIKNLRDEEISESRTDLKGDVLLPDDHHYEASRMVWNGNKQKSTVKYPTKFLKRTFRKPHDYPLLIF